MARTGSSPDFGDGHAEGGEAVQDGDPDVEFCTLPVEVPRHEPLTEQLDAVRIRLRSASTMTAIPSSPERTAEAA